MLFLVATNRVSAGVWISLTVVTFLSFCGCVRRRMTVRTSPPGAMVSVDNQVIGTSPVATPFVHYGTRDFRVELDGYRTESVRRRIKPPWYQLPVLELISDTLWPWEIRDERVIDIQMLPKQLEPAEVVIQRADQLRNQARNGIVAGPLEKAGDVSPVQPAAEQIPPGGLPATLGQ